MNLDDLELYTDVDNPRPRGTVRERLKIRGLVESLQASPMVVALMDQGNGNLFPMFGAAEYRKAGGPDNMMQTPRTTTGGIQRIFEGNSPGNTFLPEGTFLMACDPDTDDLHVLARAVELLRGSCELWSAVTPHEIQRRPSAN
jgi:hypothetical protein